MFRLFTFVKICRILFTKWEEFVIIGLKWKKVGESGSMFFGSYEHSLDSKGRLCVTAKFREKLSDILYIVKGFDGCIAVFTEQDFAPKINEYLSLSFNHNDTRAHVRINASTIEETSLDKQGRLTLSSRLLKKEGIGPEVVIVGVIDHFEIWDRNAWEKYYEENYARDEEIAENLDARKKDNE